MHAIFDHPICLGLNWNIPRTITSQDNAQLTELIFNYFQIH